MGISARARRHASVIGAVTIALVSLVLSLVVAGPPSAEAQVPEADIIDNGTVQLGVHPEAHLNVPGGTASSGTGTTSVGLRYLPTNAEATAPGCLCEGWGAGDANLGVSGYANVSTDGGVTNLDLVGFESDGVEALSVVDILNGGGDFLRVTHDFHPSPATDNLYEVTVTMTNMSGVTIEDPRYRRVMDWDIEPTAFSEFSTIEDFGSANLLYSSTNGFDTANPLNTFGDSFYTVGPPTGPNLFDNGPADHGAKFDFGFDPLLAGESVAFNIYYGAAGTEEDALTAIALVGAEVYSFGQPNTADGPTLGTPNTFIFAFSGVGGDPFAGGDRRPPLFLNVFQNPIDLPGGGGPFDVTSRAINVGDGDAHNATTRIELGPNLTLESGDNPFNLGTVAAGTNAQHVWGLNAADGGCTGYDTFYDVFLDWDEREAGDPVRTIHREVHVPGTCGKFFGNVSLFGAGPAEGATVEICPVDGDGDGDPDGDCVVETTDASGDYDPPLPEGNYNLTARPPVSAADGLLPVSHLNVPLPPGGDVRVDFVLGGPLPRPADVTIESRYEGPDGIPVLYWGDDLDLTKSDQCPGAAVWFEVRQGPDPDADGIPENIIYADPGMNESDDPVNAGKSMYSDVIPAFHPTHGYATIVIYVDCPPHSSGEFPVEVEGDNIQIFTVYIDPSGNVRTVGGDPIEGATVTLFRSDDPAGPFVQVPDGSPVMSLANQQNPDLTDAAGHFGWDTNPGYYKVRAEKDGCVDPADAGATFVETDVLPVPPIHTDLDLRLDCDGGGDGGGDGPRTDIREIREDLAADLDGVKHLDKVLKELDEADKDEYWDGDDDLSEDGKKVFDAIKKAVKELTKKKEFESEAAAQDAAAALVEIARQLAMDAIDDIPPDGDKKVEKEREKAEQHLAKGDEARDEGDLDKAVNEYKKAWEHARKASEHAGEVVAI